MRAALAGGRRSTRWGADAAADADLYLAVALRSARPGTAAAPVAGASASRDRRSLLAKANAADGSQTV